MTEKELEKNTGRLVHLGLVIPFVHHFMSRLREMHRRATHRISIKITERYATDLNLMIFMLKKANKGIDMNMLVYRKPTYAYRSDSCPMGLRGFSHTWFAWRFYFFQNNSHSDHQTTYSNILH